MLYWVSFVLVTSISAVLRGYNYRWINVPLDATTIVYATVTGLVVFHILARLMTLPIKRQAVAAIATIFVLVFVFDVGFQLIRTLLGPDAEHLTVATAVTRENVLAGGLFWFVPFCLWAAAIMALLHNDEARKRERLQLVAEAEANAQLARAADAERKAASTELSLLRLQLNPHFMCNTLGAVSTLIIEGRHDEANQTVEKLAGFLRDVADSGHSHDNLLSDEFDIVDTYLAIECFRFGDRLQVSLALPVDLEDALVPNFILQPLVENAIKHAVTNSTETVVLRVSARQDEDELVITVEDNGPDASFAQSDSGRIGIGLQNTRSRLSLRYGNTANLEAGPAERGFRSTIRLPLEIQDEIRQSKARSSG
ncbi:sensor histidine kinase [Sphingomonas sp. LaA6.9]|uniref:sensor histidine kinase n=1 Tax=Sphingomonas sp. LaA6.9 TaxID=2919914 RepID=UPI001F4F8944|nr:histidine kinase [Sphingomonas sp. LaA6.9]MCJ8156647.1 histidine kinase [Sphingomonas sp. LaA6.9]